MDKICKNCVDWERVIGNILIHNFGICSCSKFIDMSKELIYHNNIPDNICFADMDGKIIYFRTGENFGCIHFKEKEKVNDKN